MHELDGVQLFKYLLQYPMQVAAILSAIALACRLPLKNWWAWTVTAGGLLAFLVGLAIAPPGDTDIQVFWAAGTDVWNGVSPYRNPHCLNPPTAFPLYALMGLLPFPQLWLVWLIFNAVGYCLVVVLAERA